MHGGHSPGKSGKPGKCNSDQGKVREKASQGIVREMSSCT